MDERYDEKGNLKESFIDNRTGIEYNLVGDYYLPNLKLEQEEKITSPVLKCNNLFFFRI
mgnify:CR=1 FL=1